MGYLNSNKKKITIVIMLIGLVLTSIGIYFTFNKNKNNNANNNNNESNNNKNDSNDNNDNNDSNNNNESNNNKNDNNNNNDNNDNNDNNNNENNNNNNNEIDKNDDKKPVDVKNEEAKKLYEVAKIEGKMENTTNSKQYNSKLETYIYSNKEKMEPKDLTSTVFFVYKIIEFIKNERYNFEYIEYEKDNQYKQHIEIKKSELEKVLYKLFGDNFTIEDFELYSHRIVKEVINYNKEKDTYTLVKNGISIDCLTIETKLIKIEKDKDYIYLFEKIGLTTPSKSKYFSNMIGLDKNCSDENKFIENNKDKAKDLNGKSIWEYEDNLSTFRYVLKKDKNGEYHLDSMGYVEVK